MINETVLMLQPKTITFKKVRLKPFWIFLIVFFCLVKNTACNRPPRFVTDDQSEIVLRLKETPETAVGALIYRLQGFDPDNDPLTFATRPSPDSDIIRIENTGTNEAYVYLGKELDRETKDEYSIVLTLTDNHNSGESNYVTQSFLLLVEDINDNEPVFRPYQAAIEVPENSEPGIVTTLEAIDNDEGAYGQVVYYLQELDGDNDVFSISTYQGRGILRLAGQLDYETKSLYQLRVLAIDRANQGPVNTGTAGIIVKVKDTEDQPPEFVQVQAVARIPEDAPVGVLVLRVKAIDGDRGINNPIQYTIESNELFNIDNNSGDIYTKRLLDREDTSNQVNGAYIVKITATELSQLQPSPSVKTEITIIVTDVDDETPTFSEQIYRCEINENSQTNTPLNFIDDVKNFVFDHDVGNNGTFRLFIDPPNDIFEILPELAVNEATFLIRVKNPKMIDYERYREMNFTLFAREMEDPDKYSFAHLQIYIRDQNDNFPEFTEAVYNVTILENSEPGTIVTQITAFDEDSGDFGTTGIRYKNLRGGIASLLNLDPMSGILSVRLHGGEAFDREVISCHYLTVEAQDNVGLGNRNTAQIIINIHDINDNSPFFLQKYYEANLIENKVDFESPLILEARDIDLNGTENSQITYEIVEGMFQRNFTIDNKSGVLRPIRSIDFEDLPMTDSSNVRNIELLVRARDSGIPMLSTVVPVVVYIQDVNDNPPIFHKSFYEKVVSEDLSSGSSVLQVNAIDRDGSTPNNKVVYRIQSGAEDKFIVNANNGTIYLAKGASLDPDQTTSKKTLYSLNLLALDGGVGSTQLTTMSTVNITIKDVNNKLPVFHELPTLKVIENTPVGSLVYRIMASDLDEIPILRYHINKQKSEARNEDGSIVKSSEYDFISAFELNSIDGNIKIARLIDRERVEFIKLCVIVEDLGAAKGSQIVEGFLHIQIEDENDNNPKFKENFYKKTITENSMNGVLIANVLAYDVDKNKTITYSLEGNPMFTSLVHLNPQTGEIVVASRIDHELFQWLNFTVRAIDSGYPTRSSLVDIFVSVLDENDNNPYFKPGNKNYTIFENAPIGTRIGRVQATDADSGDFGKVTFLMDRISSQGKFSIDANTGVLTVVDKLDREIRDLYMLVIEAWDNYHFGFLAGESRNAFKQITIQILDVNDSPPEVTLPNGCVLITEYHEMNEVVTTIRGTDADDSNLPNGRLEMEISKGNNDGLFEIRQIDPWTSHIFVRTSLKNKYGDYLLEITVRDLGMPTNIVKKSLNICVSDFNDHAPIFVSPMHNTTFRIPENTTVGTMIIQVYATDDDTGQNALIRYRLKADPLGSYKTFEIDQETGMIYLKSTLDREKQRIYEIRIEAYDQGMPTSLCTDLDLTIYVRNVNDYEPQFLVEQIVANFTEHMDPRIQKVKLPDTIDKDEVDDLDDPPSIVCYVIIKGNEEGYFELHPETHILTVGKELDREIKANYTLYIRATENCNEILSGAVDTNAAKTKGYTSPIMPLSGMDYKNPERSEDRNLKSFTEEDEDLLTDNTVVRVLVQVVDINDNAPRFTSKIFTGGFTTSADFGTNIMKVEAYDPDDGKNAIISYYQVGEIRETLSEGLENVEKYPFIVDSETGGILLNFDPQRGMKGYFDFMVVANDTDGLQDTARVYIYLLREDQKVRFVFRLQSSELRGKIHRFKQTMSHVTNAIVNIDEYKVHENKDGSVDKTKTDLYMHLVDREDNSIYEVADVLRLIDLHIESLDELFKEFNVLDTQPAEAQLLVAGEDKAPLFVWFVFSNLFLATLLVITMTICFSQRNGFKRQLRAAKINIYHRSSLLDIPNQQEPLSSTVPNTNKHSEEGSNPIWLKGYENEWFKSDDNQSEGGRDSLDDNFLATERENALNQNGKIFQKTNDLNRHFNVYQQIDKLTNNAHILVKKLETTEL